MFDKFCAIVCLIGIITLELIAVTDWFSRLGTKNHTDAIKLKPCPFCGGEAVILKTNEFYRVCCKSCPCDVGRWVCTSESELAEFWNRRYEQ